MAPWLVQRCEEGSSRALTQIEAGAIFSSPVLQQRDPGRGVTLIRPSSLRNSAAQRQKRQFEEQRLVVGVGCVRAGAARDGATQTHPIPSPGGTTLTTFHRSLTRESTLRMSACSVPPLIPPTDRGTLSSVPSPRPHQQAQTRPDIWAETENPAQRDKEGLGRFQAPKVPQFDPD